MAMIFKKYQDGQTACFSRKHQLELEFLNRFKSDTNIFLPQC